MSGFTQATTQAQRRRYKISGTKRLKPPGGNWDFPVLVPKHTKMEVWPALDHKGFRGFCLFVEKSVWGWREVGMGGCTGGEVLPSVWIPQRCLPLFVLELSQGREPKSATHRNRACPGIQRSPERTAGGWTQLPLKQLSPPQLVKAFCLPHPQLITSISNPSLRQGPPTLWIYFTPVLVVWMKHPRLCVSRGAGGSIYPGGRPVPPALTFPEQSTLWM